MPNAAGGVIDQSVGHSAFCILPTVPQPTSADFVPQITFRISHFRKLPTPVKCGLVYCTGDYGTKLMDGVRILPFG